MIKPDNMRGTRIVRLIEVETLEGDGKTTLARIVKTYWTEDGEFVAKADPFHDAVPPPAPLPPPDAVQETLPDGWRGAVHSSHWVHQDTGVHVFMWADDTFSAMVPGRDGTLPVFTRAEAMAYGLGFTIDYTTSGGYVAHRGSWRGALYHSVELAAGQALLHDAESRKPSAVQS